MTVKLKTARITTNLTLWLLLAFSNVITFLGFGGGYAFGGNRSVYSLEPFKYIDVVPGGIVQHGVIMCLIGLLLLWSIAGIVQSHAQTAMAWTTAKISLGAMTFYSAWCVYAFSAAWISNHHYVGIMWIYLATMVAAGTLLASIHMVRHTTMQQAIRTLEAAVQASAKDDRRASASRGV